MDFLKEDNEQYQMLLDNYEALNSEDGDTAYELAKMCILASDRWNEIAFQSSKLAKKYNISKTDLYQYAYHRYRILMTLHEFCRVIYKKCQDDLRNRWGDC